MLAAGSEIALRRRRSAELGTRPSLPSATSCPFNWTLFEQAGRRRQRVAFTLGRNVHLPRRVAVRVHNEQRDAAGLPRETVREDVGVWCR